MACADIGRVTSDDPFIDGPVAGATPGRVRRVGGIEADERRRSSRRPLGAMGIVISETPGYSSQQLHVLVLNVSLGGVGFRAPVGFRPGNVYQLRIGSGPLHLSSRLEIVSSRLRHDGTYDVGAKFKSE